MPTLSSYFLFVENLEMALSDTSSMLTFPLFLSRSFPYVSCTSLALSVSQFPLYLEEPSTIVLDYALGRPADAYVK